MMSHRVHLPLAPHEPRGEKEPSAQSGHLVPVPTEGERSGLMQVGELAKAAGRTVRAIHLYEELGLLRPHGRSKGKYRLFDREALVRVRWIGKLQELGLTLGQIQGIVREWEQAPSAPGAMKLMRSTYRAKLAETRVQIARLRALEAELAASLNYLETCDTCDPARLLGACSCCELHEEEQQAPELVAGFHAGHRAEHEEARGT
ncbi:MAG: MerR family transcriptional regulator [Myxococcales bacterium]|nr:MerR family transcriptional regulator [Polyangiaceae bacterium]MDW8248013.1 MerR family transcriptional regulator [Myxococcales bacterium]